MTTFLFEVSCLYFARSVPALVKSGSIIQRQMKRSLSIAKRVVVQATYMNAGSKILAKDQDRYSASSKKRRGEP